jgi:hypothetical protein
MNFYTHLFADFEILLANFRVCTCRSYWATNLRATFADHVEQNNNENLDKKGRGL